MLLRRSLCVGWEECGMEGGLEFGEEEAVGVLCGPFYFC
jgi:hypothetical protein